MSNLILSGLKRRSFITAPAFNPNDWSNCSSDWVAEDVSVSSDPINWNSRVGSLTFTASGSARPSAGATIGGKASLRFSGTTQVMSGPNLSSLFSSSTNWSIYLVMRMKAYTQQTYLNSSYAYGNGILTNGSEYFCILGRTDHGGQLVGTHYNGTAYRFAPIHCATDRDVVLAYRGSSTDNLAYLSINDSTPVPTSTTDSTIGSLGALSLGRGSTFYGDFEVSRIFSYSTYKSVSDHNDIVAAARSFYSLPSEDWSPITAGRPSLWVDPSRSSLFQTDTTGTPATSGGDPVGRIDAAQGTNLTQTTSSARMTRSTLGSKIALLGDGTDDRLVSTQTIADAACTIALVYKYGSSLGASTRHILAVMGVSGSKTFAVHVAGASASLPYLSWQLAPVSSTAHVGADVTVGDTDLHTIIIRYLGGTVTDTANWKCSVDGTNRTVTTRAAITPAGTTSYGARSSGTSATSAVIGEFLVYEKSLTDSEVSSLHTYLSSRWT